MKVLAKFRCATVTRDAQKNEIVACHPVYGSDSDNKQWSKYTPSGSLSMTIATEGAQGFFEPGEDYFLEITKAS